MRLILASQSPRRIELLSLLGLPFEPVVSNCGESYDGSAKDAVRELALRKAVSVSREITGTCAVLGADTLVERDGITLSKPRDTRHAKEMLRTLSDGWHNVHTGVALVTGDTDPLAEVVSVRVHFAPMSEGDIEAYIASGEPMDKAGAYGIQGKAGAYIDRIEGDYYAVVGLPLCLVRQMLDKAGVYNAPVGDKLHKRC